MIRGYLAIPAGMPIVESVLATALPSGKPRTDDMREMVEHFHRLGLIRRKPAAFEIAGKLVVHPAIVSELRKRISRATDDIAARACGVQP